MKLLLSVLICVVLIFIIAASQASPSLPSAQRLTGALVFAIMTMLILGLVQEGTGVRGAYRGKSYGKLGPPPSVGSAVERFECGSCVTLRAENKRLQQRIKELETQDRRKGTGGQDGTI